MKRVALATALALTVTAPLRAQSVAPMHDPSLNCVLDAVPADQRVLAGPAASQQLTDAPEEAPELSGAALETIRAALSRCAETSHWTENQRELALQYTLMQLTRDDMIRRYAAQNVDLTYIDQMIAAAQPNTAFPFEAMVARMRAQGVGDNRPDSAADIVWLYMMMVAQSAKIRANFADPNFRPQ